MRVRGDVRDPVAGANAELLEHQRLTIATIKELLVREAEVTVDDGLAVGVEPTRAAHEVECLTSITNPL